MDGRAAGGGEDRRQGLRILDAGTVSALRSQALWHGVAEAMTPAAEPALSFCRSREPYVGLGFHRSLAEIDRQHCRSAGYPVIRRQIGGGPVFVDGDQLLFQITLPADQAPPRVDRLFAELLAPAVSAFRALGVAARLSGLNDIAVAERKLSGTGAGRIGDGVTVVGNVLFHFPHERMARVLALPTPSARAECLALMRRHVTSLAGEGRGGIGYDEARDRLVEAFARALGRAPRPSSFDGREEAAIRRWEKRFVEAEWLAGSPEPPAPRRSVKISADAWLYLVDTPQLAIELSVAGGTIVRARLRGAALNGDGERIGRALAGLPAEEGALRRRLEELGAPALALATELVPGLRLR